MTDAPTLLREPKDVRVARDVHVNVLLLATAQPRAPRGDLPAGGPDPPAVRGAVDALPHRPRRRRRAQRVGGRRPAHARASDTTRLVDRLARAGLAERLPNPADRRSVLVRATPAGRRTFAAVTPELQAFHRTQWAHLTPTEIDTLDRLLTKALWGEG